VNDHLTLVSRRLSGLLVKRPAFVLGLWGAPGIGKTYAVQALLRQTPCRHLSLHATAPAAHLLRDLPTPAKLPSWAARTVERNAAGEHIETSGLTDAIGAVLASLAPFIVHLEDLHEASTEGREFVEKLARGVSRLKGVALIVTSREPPPESFEALHLEPLSLIETTRMLEGEAGAVLPAEAALWIYERAAGNPLFTLEFFRFLARQGAAWNDGQRWRWRTPERDTLPVTVEALIEHIIARAMAEPVLRNAIHAKAVLGRGVDSTIWAAVAGLEPKDFNAAITQLEREGLIAGGEFAHPLYGEVIARDLTLERRRSLARRALKALATDPRSATNFVAAADLEPETAVAWFRKAAVIAEQMGDAVQVSRFIAKAVQYAKGEEGVQLALEAAKGLRRVDIPEATRLTQVAESMMPGNIEGLQLHAELLASQGLLKEANCILERLPLRERSGKRWLLQLLKIRAVAQANGAVIELWRQHPELDLTQDPTIAYAVAHALVSLGSSEEAEILALQILAKPSLKPDERCLLLGVLGSVRYHTGDNEGAEAFETQAIEAAHEAQRPDLVALQLHNRAVTRGDQGRQSEQIADLREAVNIETAMGNSIMVVNSQVAIADALLDLAQYEEAEELLLECCDALKQVHTSDHSIECEYRLSQLYRDWKPTHGGILAIKHARAALQNARSIANPRKIGWSLCYAAIAEARFGDAHQSEKLAGEALEVATQLSSPGQIGMANLAKALAHEALGEHELALNKLRKLESKLLEQNLTDPAQEVGLEIDRLLGDATSAASRLEWFEMHGLKNMSHIARRYFPELATDTTPKSSSPLEQHLQPRLEVLGTLQVSLEGAVTPVRGRKRQELLALLLEARISGRGEISKLELIDKLYPEADELQSNAGLRDVIYQLRSNLGNEAIITTTGGYALGNLSSDLEEFLKHGDTRLWRGTYLAGLTFSGSDTVCESVYLALRSRAEALLETDPVETTRVGRLLCEADPYDLEAVRLTLMGLRLGGNHRSLSRVYEGARTRFLEIGETLPAVWQDFLTPVGANP
jgi:tetratricopeptide (TPR) repeat protein